MARVDRFPGPARGRARVAPSAGPDDDGPPGAGAVTARARSVARTRRVARTRPLGPPFHGLDEAAFRFIEVHETRAHALGGRLIRDLGDCVLLHAPRDRDPFFNRVAAVRWPRQPARFERRLADLFALFAGLDRRPHIWTAPAFNTPADLGPRLVDQGFREVGAGYVMALVRPRDHERCRPEPGVTVERLHGGPGVTVRDQTVREIARLLGESFAVDPDRHEAIAAEVLEAFGSPAFHVCLVRSDGEPVAVGKRYTFDGASYLSSIGTRPRYRGRGHGLLVTEVLIEDAIAAGSRPVYLSVNAHNDRAISVYRRAGLDIVGGRAGDYLLAPGTMSGR